MPGRNKKRSNGTPPTGPRATNVQWANSATQAPLQNVKSDHNNKKCTFHGWNHTHVTKDCHQINNQNQTRNFTQQQDQNQTRNANNGNTRYCNLCKTSTHNTINCKRTNSQFPRQPRVPAPINTTGTRFVAPQPLAMDWSANVTQQDISSRAESTKRYCPFCNSRSHSKHTCQNTEGMRNFFQSRLACRACGNRGHLFDDCRCPTTKRCDRCFRKGHHPSECRVVPSHNPPVSALRTSFLLPGNDRFKWQIPENVLHKSQRMRAMWEEYQHEVASQGGTIPEAVRLATERQIAAAANVFENPPNQSQINLRRPSGIRSTPTTFHGGRVPNIAGIKRPQKLINTSLLRGAGLKTADISALELFMTEQQIALAGERGKAINRKIDQSRAYGKELVNFPLLRLETRIMEKELVSPERFQEVKYALMRGWNFFREPQGYGGAICEGGTSLHGLCDPGRDCQWPLQQDFADGVEG